MDTQQIISLFVGIAGFIIAIYKLIEDKIFGIKVFEERKKAQRRMVMDMVKSTELNYVGITHEKMVSYFKEAFNEDEEPKWQVINFFFPASEYGRCWDADFDNKMNLSILKISDYLMNKKAGNLKELRQVNFYLNSCSFNIGGSLFKYINSKQNYTVIYDVLQVKGNYSEQDKANTIRLRHRRYKPFFKRFEGMFEEIKKSAKLLYAVNVADKDLWNQSASDWDEYEQYDISPHSKSMEYMLNEINVNNCMNVLSLGAGTGNMEKLLLANKMYKGFLGLVDKSYTMLSQAYDQLCSEENKKVSYALIDLSKRDWELYGALAGRKYDYILMHFSLHNFISQEQNIKSFAGRLKQILAYGGEIIVAIHDHVYGSIDEEEELRSKIRDFAKKNSISLKGKSKTISLHDLKSEFFKNKLLVVKERVLPLERNMKERIMMWKVDAILDSMLNVDELKNKNLKDKLFKELGEIETEESASMIVNYISFSDIIRVSSALILNDKGEFLTVVKNGAYLLPGGEMWFNEGERQTLLRELDEELEISADGIVIGERLGVFHFKKAYLEDKPLQMIVHRCELKQTMLNPRNEISDYEWIDLKKFTTLDNMPKEYFLKILKAANIMLQETKETK